MPMQPRPMAETSKLLIPSLRFCMDGDYSTGDKRSRPNLLHLAEVVSGEGMGRVSWFGKMPISHLQPENAKSQNVSDLLPCRV